MYADQPFWVGLEAMMERMYAGHGLSHRVLGTNESVGALTIGQMASYFDARYTPDNTVLVAAGNIDFDALVRDAGSLCGSWRPASPKRTYTHWNPGRAESVIRLKNAARAYILLTMPAPSIQDELRYAAGMLMSILGSGDGSRLHWALVEPGLAEEASAMYDGHDGTGDSTLFAVCDPDKVGEIETILRRELASVVSSLDEGDLVRARNRIATGAAAAAERPNGRMFRLGTLWGYGAGYTTLDEEVDRISRVTLDEIKACCRAFPLEPTVKVVVMPDEDE